MSLWHGRRRYAARLRSARGRAWPSTGPDAVPASPAPTEEAAVADAGSATVRLEGAELVLDDVTPAEGWQHTVDSETPSEVEVEVEVEVEDELTRDDRVLDPEVEIEVEIEDDGVPAVEVCADDD